MSSSGFDKSEKDQKAYYGNLVEKYRRNLGFIYILRNNAYKEEIFKVGKTRKQPKERANKLFKEATGVPSEFEVVYHVKVSNVDWVEKSIHKILIRSRVNHSREFFKIPLADLLAVVNGVASKNKPYPILEHDQFSKIKDTEYIRENCANCGEENLLLLFDCHQFPKCRKCKYYLGKFNGYSEKDMLFERHISKIWVFIKSIIKLGIGAIVLYILFILNKR